MLGREHALAGALGGVVVVGALSRGGDIVASTAEIAIAAVVGGGFGLLPDLDEPGSTVSRKFGMVSRGLSKVTKTVAGGHRMLTHSLLMVLVVFGLVDWASKDKLAVAIIGGLSVWVALQMTIPFGLGRRIHWPVLLAGSAALAYVMYMDHMTGLWLAIAAAVGYGTHLVCDSLTVEGVPWLYPYRGKFHMALVGHTASARETVAGLLFSCGIVLGFWVYVFHYMVIAHR